MAIPSPSENSQPATPSVSGRPRTRTKSSSMPAMKNSIARPNAERNTTSGFSVAQFSPYGPIRMPPASSATTTGMRTPRGMIDQDRRQHGDQHDQEQVVEIAGAHPAITSAMCWGRPLEASVKFPAGAR